VWGEISGALLIEFGDCLFLMNGAGRLMTGTMASGELERASHVVA
jgi:hypothetical protein